MTSIIIVTYNNVALTKQCLDSLFRYTAGDYELIVIDNNSTDGTVKLLEETQKKYPNRMQVLYNKENIGFIKANNQGILMAKGEYICLCNNDLIFTFNWLRRLKRCLENHPECGMVGPYSNYVSGRQQVRPPQFKTPKEMEEFPISFSMKEQPIERLVFFCVLIRAELFRKEVCGLLDTDFGMGNFEDDYFCWLAVKAGWKLRIANCFIWHIGSQSFRKDLDAFAKLLGRNQKTFYRKTGREIKISLCMVVGDYEKPETLRRCLESIAPFVDEVCVNFTYRHWSSFKRYKRLYHLPYEVMPAGSSIQSNYEKWRWDFAYHRNKSKKLATGDWLIWLDAADTFQSSTLLRKYIVENAPIADYMFVNVYATAEDGVTTHLRHARILRNKPEFYWVKPIHEDIVLSLKKEKARMVSSDLIVNHHGYEKKGVTYAKNRRNYKIMKRHIINNPDADSLDLYHLTNTYILLGGETKSRKWYRRAIGAIDRCLKIPLPISDPLWPKMTFLKARVYHEMGNYEEAKAWYRTGIKEKNYIESHLGMAEVLVAEKNHKAALGHLETMLKIGMGTGFEVTSVPKNLRELEEGMFYNLGLCHFNLERYKEAKEVFQKCLMLNKNHLLAIGLLCECLMREGNHNTAFHINLLTINRVPTYVLGWVNCGGYEMMNKRYHTARIFFMEALRLDSRHKIAKKNLKIITTSKKRLNK